MRLLLLLLLIATSVSSQAQQVNGLAKERTELLLIVLLPAWGYMELGQAALDV
jgi:hypothetical protein